MITESWVRAEIERAMAGQASRENVYDLSALITVLGYMTREAADGTKEPSGQSMAAGPRKTEEERRTREAIILTNHSADLDTVPTLEQVMDALGEVRINDQEEEQTARDIRTWGQIIGRIQ